MNKQWKELPVELVHQICIFTGKFKLQKQKSKNKLYLQSIIDINSDKWVTFNELYKLCARNKLAKIRCFWGLGGLYYSN